jgi:hypothetical protein
MVNPMTTTGDTIYSSSGSTPARLGIGSTGQVLTVSGGVPAWAAAGGGLKAFTLLNAGGTALTGATTITVSGISNQQAIFVRVDAASSVNANAGISLRINNDTNTKYIYLGVNHGATTNQLSTDNTTSYALGALSSNAGSVFVGTATILGTNSASGFMRISSNGMAQAFGGSGQVGYSQQGIYEATAPLTSISLVSSTGNFDAGTLYIYGMEA